MSASNDLFNWSSQFPLQTNLQTRIACLANPFTAEALASEFVNNKAIFHKNCTRKYRADMLARKRKSQDSEAASSVSNDLKISPKKTRSTFSAPNFTDNCFFCDDSEGELLLCYTKELSKHVANWAKALSDSKVLAKLSAGDMVATESKYHKICLTGIFNRFYQQQKKNKVTDKEHLCQIEGVLYC